MNKPTFIEIQGAFKKLPRAIQDLYFSEDIAKTAQLIGNKYHLHIDQIGALGDEIGLVMLGFTPTSKFTDHLIERLKVDSDQAKNITNEVNKEIFAKIRAELQKREGETEPDRDQVLNEIENPPKAAASAGSFGATKPGIFEQKVSQIFNLPAEKADVTPASAEATARQSPPETPKKPWEQDPYLERP